MCVATRYAPARCTTDAAARTLRPRCSPSLTPAYGAQRALLPIAVGAMNITGLHVPIVGPTGRSDPGYVRLSVRPVGQTGRTDCSRTAIICQSHQCGLLADYNTAYAAA